MPNRANTRRFRRCHSLNGGDRAICFPRVQKKVAPVPDGAFGPNSATVPRNDARHRGQADAGAGKLFGCMQSLEWLEQFVGKTHVEPRAIIPDEGRRSRFRVRSSAELDSRRRRGPGIFPRISREDFLKRSAKAGRRPRRRRRRRCRIGPRAPGSASRQFRRDRARRQRRDRPVRASAHRDSTRDSSSMSSISSPMRWVAARTRRR